MSFKKLLPYVLFALLGLLAIGLKRCKLNNTAVVSNTSQNGQPPKKDMTTGQPPEKLDRNTRELYFTKHAKCRMACRHITQQEVRDILATGTINYNKSNLHNPKGPTYAMEGNTKDRQHVRIIFAPKQRHLSVVTVIDLEEEYKCNCD